MCWVVLAATLAAATAAAGPLMPGGSRPALVTKSDDLRSGDYEPSQCDNSSVWPSSIWCTQANCSADAAEPVLEGLLYRFFPLPNRSFHGGTMRWAEHNVAQLSGDALFGCVDNAYGSYAGGGNTLLSAGHFRWSTAYGQYSWCEDAERNPDEPGNHSWRPACRYSAT